RRNAPLPRPGRSERPSRDCTNPLLARLKRGLQLEIREAGLSPLRPLRRGSCGSSRRGPRPPLPRASPPRAALLRGLGVEVPVEALLRVQVHRNALILDLQRPGLAIRMALVLVCPLFAIALHAHSSLRLGRMISGAYGEPVKRM